MERREKGREGGKEREGKKGEGERRGSRGKEVKKEEKKLPNEV